MTKQTTVRIPDELADQAEAVARVQGVSVNALIVESLAAEIERVRKHEDFTDRAAPATREGQGASRPSCHVTGY